MYVCLIFALVFFLRCLFDCWLPLLRAFMVSVHDAPFVAWGLDERRSFFHRPPSAA